MIDSMIQIKVVKLCEVIRHPWDHSNFYVHTIFSPNTGPPYETLARNSFQPHQNDVKITLSDEMRVWSAAQRQLSLPLSSSISSPGAQSKLLGTLYIQGHDKKGEQRWTKGK